MLQRNPGEGWEQREVPLRSNQKGAPHMLLKTLSDVTLQDVEALCDNRVIEGRFLDFKADKIGSADRDKREFLADVTAFANAAGGDLILGVRTKDGAADDICGIDLIDPTRKPND